MDQRPNAIVFDMDGLMLDTERMVLDAWRRAADEQGLNVPEELYLAVIGMNGVSTRALMLERLGDDFPLDALTRRTSEIYRERVARDGVAHKRGLIELLDWLQHLGVPRAVATSTRHEMAMEKLARAGISKYFDVVIGGDQVAHGKPAPDIYLAAARDLTLPPGECVALEDSTNGAAAAHAAGMPVIVVPDLVAPTATTRRNAVAVVESLTDAQRLIARALGM